MLPREAEHDLTLRAAETRGGSQPAIRGMRTPSWDFSVNTLDIVRELGLLYDSSLMADDDPYELMVHGSRPGLLSCPGMDSRRCSILQLVRFSALRPYTPPSAVEEIFRRIRRRVGRRRAVPADHASPHNRPPLAHLDRRRADPPRQVEGPGQGCGVVRHPRRSRRLRQGARGMSKTSASSPAGRAASAAAAPSNWRRAATTSRWSTCSSPR